MSSNNNVNRERVSLLLLENLEREKNRIKKSIKIQDSHCKFIGSKELNTLIAMFLYRHEYLQHYSLQDTVTIVAKALYFLQLKSETLLFKDEVLSIGPTGKKHGDMDYCGPQSSYVFEVIKSGEWKNPKDCDVQEDSQVREENSRKLLLSQFGVELTEEIMDIDQYFYYMTTWDIPAEVSKSSNFKKFNAQLDSTPKMQNIPRIEEMKILYNDVICAAKEESEKNKPKDKLLSLLAFYKRLEKHSSFKTVDPTLHGDLAVVMMDELLYHKAMNINELKYLKERFEILPQKNMLYSYLHEAFSREEVSDIVLLYDKWANVSPALLVTISRSIMKERGVSY